MASMLKLVTLWLVLSSLGLWFSNETSYAHAIGQRYDLPIPLSFFLFGGAVTVALSFLVISVFVKPKQRRHIYPRHNVLAYNFISIPYVMPAILNIVKLASVGAFLLIIISGLAGTSKPTENISPTFIWIIWWVGMGYVSALIGNVWFFINPWRILYEWGEVFFDNGFDHRSSGIVQYPKQMGIWPAVCFLLIFSWLENVYGGSVIPFQLAIMIVLYSAITWIGMFLFGKHKWLRSGEVFTVLFTLFSKFSFTEVRVTDNQTCSLCGFDCNPSGSLCVDCYECYDNAKDHQREINVRPCAVGLFIRYRIDLSIVAFVLIALANVTFDGLQETSVWSSFQNMVNRIFVGSGTGFSDIIDTISVILVPLVFTLVYLGFSCSIKLLSREKMLVLDVAKTFVFSLIPIALAYNMAHFMSLLVVQGQLIIPLASDPLGVGWDLLGSDDYLINVDVMNVQFIWFMSVGAIVTGHVVSVYVAHVIAVQTFLKHSTALRSQYPMMVLMICYTAISLWIIAQPIVK